MLSRDNIFYKVNHLLLSRDNKMKLEGEINMDVTAEEFKNLPVMEKVKIVENLEYLKVSTTEIKQRFEISRYELSHLKRLSKRLSDTVKSIIAKSSFSQAHARAITCLSHDQQEKIVREAIAKRWRLQRLTKEVKAVQGGHNVHDNAEYYESLSENISSQIGHPVIVRPSKEDQATGIIEIKYFGYDAFDGVMARLNVQLEADY